MKVLQQTVYAAMLIVSFACTNNEEYVDITTTDNDENVLAENEILEATLNLPPTPFSYNAALPAFFLNNQTNQEDNTPNNNPITNSGATLGRVLFYDTKMSLNNTVSCASCHEQSKGFSDSNTFSVGFNGELTGRNSMGLANARFYDNGRFFWDERAATLEDQVLMPIQDHIEMGMTLNELVQKLEVLPYYQVLFTNAFGDEKVTSNRISLALSQFIRSMVSYASKYDEGLQQTNNQNANFPNFTASENLGKNLFFSNRIRCSDCHDTNAFVGDRARNNGLDAVLTDLGVGAITGNNNDNGEFKVPSLRNIELTAPYMHDGRFTTLREVIEHYNNGVQNSPNLDGRLQQGNGVLRLNLNNQEIQGLVDFLITLTDENFITDEKFSNPFKE